MTGTDDPARTREAARRRERRAAVRAHHPDAGGDPVALQEALRAVDRRYAAAPAATDPPEVGERAGTAPTLRTRLRAGVVAVRERIPVGWPGHRRLIDLGPRRPADD